jgi:nicotinate-nucleotide adenylyltransferase
MRIGVYGGTFDPPHLGHLILAAEAVSQLGLDRLLWVLTPVPPHKLDKEISPIAQRLELVMAALDSDAQFELSRVDMDRSGPHYSIDTLRLLRKDFPDDQLVFLMGGDSLHDLPYWFNPTGLVAACDIIGVMRRPGDDIDLSILERQVPGLASKVVFVDTPLIEISSHEIRARIANHQPFRYYLSPAVYDLIVDRGYYRLI